MNKLMQFVTIFILLVAVTLSAETKVGDTAPEFMGTTLNGVEFSVKEASKDSIIVLFFMGYT